VNIGHIAGGTHAGWRTVYAKAKDWICPKCDVLLKYHWKVCPNCNHPRVDD
jgi:rubrerythrin